MSRWVLCGDGIAVIVLYLLASSTMSAGVACWCVADAARKRSVCYGVVGRLGLLLMSEWV